MAKLILPGGSDVGEVALFSVDALPAVAPDRRGQESLEERGFLMRLPTGIDGGYLLHVYADEPVPEDLLRCCIADDAMHGRLKLEQGKLGFGGLESLFSGWKPNDSIRSDGDVRAGDYRATVYRTRYPEHWVRRQIEAKLGEEAPKHLGAPVKIVVTALAAIAAAVLVKAWFVALLIILAAALSIQLFLKHPTTRALLAEKRAVELEYPSIVVALSSVHIVVDV